MNIQKVGSGDVRNDEAVLNKSGGLCAGTAHDVGDPLFMYKLGLAEEKLHLATKLCWTDWVLCTHILKLIMM